MRKAISKIADNVHPAHVCHSKTNASAIAITKVKARSNTIDNTARQLNLIMYSSPLLNEEIDKV